MNRILCVEDSTEVQLILKKLLVPQYEVVLVTSLREARTEMNRTSYDLILLDIGLPDGDGLRLCSEIKSNPRYQNTPIFIVSSNQSLSEKTIGFQLGIDDYICKPFDPSELRLRIEAKLKKTGEQNQSKSNMTIGDLHIDFLGQKIVRQTSAGTSAIELSSTEFKILNFLVRNRGHVKSREQIISFVWGNQVHLSDRTIDSHISRIRKKIKGSDCQIEAVQNCGYRFDCYTQHEKAAA